MREQLLEPESKQRRSRSSARRLTMVWASLVMSGGVLFATPTYASADWVGSNCVLNMGNASGAVTREQAKSFFQSMSAEGYFWGGGCWNDNNVDDVPGQVPQATSPRGEGPDCSGFVWKAWMLKATNTTSFYYNPPIKYTHGPSTANSYRSSTTAWSLPYSTPRYWDAYASTSHIGIFNSAVSGGGLFWEAKSEAVGSGFFVRNYNVSSSYRQSRRTGWAG